MTMTEAMRLKYHRTELWTDAADVKAIERITARYERLMATTGSTITTTAVIRRAIRLLDQHTRRQNFLTPGPRLAEVSAMADVINSR